MNLLCLPGEVLLLIGQHCLLGDKLALSVVCKDLYKTLVKTKPITNEDLLRALKVDDVNLFYIVSPKEWLSCSSFTHKYINLAVDNDAFAVTRLLLSKMKYKKNLPIAAIPFHELRSTDIHSLRKACTGQDAIVQRSILRKFVYLFYTQPLSYAEISLFMDLVVRYNETKVFADILPRTRGRNRAALEKMICRYGSEEMRSILRNTTFAGKCLSATLARNSQLAI